MHHYLDVAEADTVSETNSKCLHHCLLYGKSAGQTLVSVDALTDAIQLSLRKVPRTYLKIA